MFKYPQEELEKCLHTKRFTAVFLTQGKHFYNAKTSGVHINSDMQLVWVNSGVGWRTTHRLLMMKGERHQGNSSETLL